MNYESGKNLEIKERLKSKYAHKNVSGGRIVHYMQRLPIRWLQGGRKRWSLACSAFRYLCCYFHFTRPRTSDVFNKLLIIDNSSWSWGFQKSEKMCWRETSSLFPSFVLAFIFSCVWRITNDIYVISCYWSIWSFVASIITIWYKFDS